MFYTQFIFSETMIKTAYLYPISLLEFAKQIP